MSALTVTARGQVTFWRRASLLLVAGIPSPAIPMSAKLSSLFFSTVRRAARLQSQALKRAVRVATKAAGKPPAKKPAARKAAPGKAGRPVKGSAAALSAPSHSAGALAPGGGSWQMLVHETTPTRTELLGRLSYGLYRPASTSLAGMPLVIMLHGCQQTAVDIAVGSRMNRLAARQGFVVAYPQQMPRVESTRCWRWFEPVAGKGLAEADAVADLARSLVRRYRLDAGRVYVAGLSAGAGMAALAALRHPGLFAAVAMHSGAVIAAARDTMSGVRTMRHGSEVDPVSLLASVSAFDASVSAFDGSPSGVPAIIVHGSRDRVVSARNAVQLAQQFCAVNGVAAARDTVLAKGTHREYERRDFRGDGRSVVRLCLVKELGHAWSGGDERVKFHSAKGPAASLLIWRFFEMHRRAPA